jgi:tetratricopeptide (TPR) repeat protein
MNKTLIALLILFVFAGCSPPMPQNQMMEEIRENAGKKMEAHNAKTLAWQNLIDSLYNLADTNHLLALKTIDNLIVYDTSLDRHKISELHFIKGDIYYRVGNLKQSVVEFTTELIKHGDSPKYLAARAGALMKLEQHDHAFADLSRAAAINYSYLWNVGNYYEIIGKNDSAIANYDRLYKYHHETYQYCLDRINELKEPGTKPFTELIYRDRKRVVVMLTPVN